MILRSLIIFAFIWFVGKILRALILGTPPRKRVDQTPPPLVQDPSCGVYFDPRSAAWILTAHGEKKYFCSKECYEKFLRDNHGNQNINIGQNVP